MSATAAAVQGSYTTTWAWSSAFHEHPSRVDGICYRARHDDDGLAIALFERASAALELIDTTPLLDPSMHAVVARWLDRYGLGLNA